MAPLPTDRSAKGARGRSSGLDRPPPPVALHAACRDDSGTVPSHVTWQTTRFMAQRSHAAVVCALHGAGKTTHRCSPTAGLLVHQSGAQGAYPRSSVQQEACGRWWATAEPSVLLHVLTRSRPVTRSLPIEGMTSCLPLWGSQSLRPLPVRPAQWAAYLLDSRAVHGQSNRGGLLPGAVGGGAWDAWDLGSGVRGTERGCPVHYSADCRVITVYLVPHALCPVAHARCCALCPRRSVHF